MLHPTHRSVRWKEEGEAALTDVSAPSGPRVSSPALDNTTAQFGGVYKGYMSLSSALFPFHSVRAPQGELKVKLCTVTPVYIPVYNCTQNETTQQTQNNCKETHPSP